MFTKPSIPSEFQKYIIGKLNEIELQHQVKILLAVESGSRAWGFPSIDSDYDVRFIYTRCQDDYLTIREFRDVIESPIYQDSILGTPFDLNGWDIRKALQLALNSNPVLMEWLSSPIVYIANTKALEALLIFAKQEANLQSYGYHYNRIARNSWEQILTNSKQVKTKLYCYALRPALASEWILLRKETPPMDLPTLCNGIVKDAELTKEIGKLVDYKTKVQEGKHVPRNPILDAYLESVFENKIERPTRILIDRPSAEEANQLFRMIISYG